MAKPKNISKQTVEEIRNLYNEGKTQKFLAEQFKLSQSTICKIVNNYIHRTADVCVSGKANTRYIIKKSYKYGN